MEPKDMRRIRLNASTALTLGAAIAAGTALLVDFAANDIAVWIFSVPVGVAATLSVVAGLAGSLAGADEWAEREPGENEGSIG